MVSGVFGPSAALNAADISRVFDRCASRWVTTWLTSTASACSAIALATRSGTAT